MRIFPRKGDWIPLILRWILLLLVCILSLLFFTKMPGSSHSGLLQPLSAEEQEVCSNLKQHIFALAKEIGERNIWKYGNLKASADYIDKLVTESGYEVRKKEYRVNDVLVENLEWELNGAQHPKEIILIGAHYDSVLGSPGANDNASGVAAVLEISRLLRTETPARTIRFVAFVNEEPPFFQTGRMGSRIYASQSRQSGENIIAMISLETIGYYSDEKGSQRYPFPFSFFYPDTGNFIGFVGNVSSRPLVHEALDSFRGKTAFPSEGIAAPGWLPGIGWSDNWSFWEEGYPAIMVTDTAPFRYPYYHTRHDTPDKIHYERMARVVEGLIDVIRELAQH
jgi:hypothetical protein